MAQHHAKNSLSFVFLLIVSFTLSNISTFFCSDHIVLYIWLQILVCALVNHCLLVLVSQSFFFFFQSIFVVGFSNDTLGCRQIDLHIFRQTAALSSTNIFLVQQGGCMTSSPVESAQMICFCLSALYSELYLLVCVCGLTVFP